MVTDYSSMKQRKPQITAGDSYSGSKMPNELGTQVQETSDVIFSIRKKKRRSIESAGRQDQNGV